MLAIGCCQQLRRHDSNPERLSPSLSANHLFSKCLSHCPELRSHLRRSMITAIPAAATATAASAIAIQSSIFAVFIADA